MTINGVVYLSKWCNDDYLQIQALGNPIINNKRRIDGLNRPNQRTSITHQ